MRKAPLYCFGLVVTILVALGLVVLLSAGESNAIRLHHGDAYYFIRRQFEYLVVGLVACACAACFDYRKWRDCPALIWVAFVATLVMLGLVFGFRAINGSHRWFSLGPIRVQPSEFAKLVTVILIAVWMDRAGWRVELFRRGALYPAILIGILAAPIMREPDFGATMVVGLSGFLMMWMAGTRFLHLLPFVIMGGGVVAYKVFTNANRMARISAFFGVKIDMGAEVMDAAAERAEYQARQALVAIGRSDVWGAGLGESMQKYLYLPEAHTDFIFAIGAEELGICFSLGVVFLFLTFFALAIYIARKASDQFGRYLATGMAFIIFFPAMFNVGVVCKALPTKGMALPFFSYGGTNLVCAFIAVGTILSVGIHSYREQKCKKLGLDRILSRR